MFGFFKSSSDKSQTLFAVVKNGQVTIKTSTNVVIRAIGYGMNGKAVNCQVSPDSKHVVATTDKGYVCISDIAVGGIKRAFGTTTFGQAGGKAINATWSDDETLLVNTDKGYAFSLKIKTGSTRKMS